jgi:hypothetical protein
MVAVLCRSDGCAQDLEIPHASHHGGESGVEILLLHKLWLADLRQGIHATAS